jgi:hypothetical protein
MRNRLLGKYNRKKLPKDWNLYKTQRNLTVHIIRKEKASYYVKLNATLSNPKKSAKKWWGATSFPELQCEDEARHEETLVWAGQFCILIG